MTKLKRFLSWFAMLIIGIIIVLFSVSNRTIVTLDFWPFPILYEAPIYFPMLTIGFLGFILGAITAWFSAGRTRSKVRKANRRASILEKDLVLLQNKIDELDERRKNTNTEH